MRRRKALDTLEACRSQCFLLKEQNTGGKSVCVER